MLLPISGTSCALFIFRRHFDLCEEQSAPPNHRGIQMTLKSKMFLVVLSALTFAATSANAYITPGGGRPAPYPDPRPAPYPGPGPVTPGYPPAPEPAPYPNQPQPGYGQFTVDLNVYTRLYANDRLDLTQYIDSYRYNGYRIVRIDISATPDYQTAFINLMINGFAVGGNLQIDNYNCSATAYPDNAVIGQSAASIVLYTQGNMTVNSVTLTLAY